MAIQNGSYDEFVKALQAQAPQPVPAPTPTGGAIDIRNRLFSPPAPTTPAPKPRADAGDALTNPASMRAGINMIFDQAAAAQGAPTSPPAAGIDYTPTGSTVAPADASMMPRAFWPATNARVDAAVAARDDAKAAFAEGNYMGGAGGVLRMLGNEVALPVMAGADALGRFSAGLTGRSAQPKGAEASPQVSAPTTPSAAEAAAATGLPITTHHTGEMSPETHSLEDFVAANKHITLNQALHIMQTRPRMTAQEKAQGSMLDTAMAIRDQEMKAAAASGDPQKLIDANNAHFTRLQRIYNPQSALFGNLPVQK